MSQTLQAEFNQAASRFFEALGCRPASRPPADEPLKSVVSVGFRGPACGRIELSLYGNIGSVTPRSELAVRVSCSVLQSMAAGNEQFELDPPLVHTARRSVHGLGLEVAQAEFESDHGRAEVRLFLLQPRAVPCPHPNPMRMAA